MKKIKNLIILLLIIILLIIGIKIIANKINENRNIDGLGADYEIKNYTPMVENNASSFYTVEECVQRYLDYTTINTESTSDEKLDKYNSIYKLLDSDFISANSITTENIPNTIALTDTPIKFTALEMEYVCYDSNLQEYRVYGKMCNKDTGKLIGYSFYKVTLDCNNETFTIEPIKKCNNINEIPLDDYEIDKVIDNNLYNEYYSYSIREEGLMNYYFDYIKNALLYTPQEIYNILESEYRKSKFPTLESFNSFINENKDIIEEMELKNFETEDMIVYKIFTCEDKNQKRYIINQDAIMKFSLILDY